MTEDKTDEVATGECGACRAVIPIDSEACPECNISFSGVSDEALGECGACHGLVPLDSTKCTHCGTVFIADDVVDVLRNWLATTGITIPMLFKKFDTDGDGQIDSSELKTGLLSLNLADLPPSQVERLIETIDSDGDGRLDLGELHATITGEELPPSELETLSSDAEEEESVEETDDEPTETQEEADTEHEEDDTEEVDDEPSEIESTEVESEEADEESTEPIEEDSSEQSDEDESEDDDEEGTEDDHEHSDEIEDVSESIPLIRRIADAMDDEGTSPNYFFSKLDRDADGGADVTELTNALTTLLDDEVTYEEIEDFLIDVDGDGNRRIDMFEFIIALEALDDADELMEEESGQKTEKPFPTNLQKSMMGKQWNDIVWPLMHLAFGLFIALLVLNAFGGIGPLSVDGTGGTVELEIKGNLIHQDELVNGDIYACDPEYQVGDCKNSLTPFAGDASSMPAGFYWDGILFMILGAGALVGSLYAHLVLMATWRARSRAMKEVLDDQSDASEEVSSDDEAAEEVSSDDDAADKDEESEEDDSLEEEMDEVLEDTFEEHELGEDDDSEEKSEDEPDEEIDIGSHIGLALEDEEVYGKIIEFDDDEGTVTIKEDGSGEEITGYQEDIFLE